MTRSGRSESFTITIWTCVLGVLAFFTVNASFKFVINEWILIQLNIDLPGFYLTWCK
jgi:hypothetical protein